MLLEKFEQNARWKEYEKTFRIDKIDSKIVFLFGFITRANSFYVHALIVNNKEQPYNVADKTSKKESYLKKKKKLHLEQSYLRKWTTV